MTHWNAWKGHWKEKEELLFIPLHKAVYGTLTIDLKTDLPPSLLMTQVSVTGLQPKTRERQIL